MESIIQSLPQLAPYQPALLWLVVLCLVVLIQSFLAGALGLCKSDEVPGQPLQGNHDDASFRILRTYANSTENFSVFVATAFLAILTGVSVALVNGLVALHVAFRVVYWAIYYSGVGKVGGGVRTMTYVGGYFLNLILAVLAAYAVLT